MISSSGGSIAVDERRAIAARLSARRRTAQPRQPTHSHPCSADQPYRNFGVSNNRIAPTQTKPSTAMRAAFELSKKASEPLAAAASAKYGSQLVVSVGGNGVQPVIKMCPEK